MEATELGAGSSSVEPAPKRSPKAKAKNKVTKGTGGRASEKTGPCIVPACEEPKFSKFRVCKMHKRTMDGLTFQIERCGDAQLMDDFYKDFKDDVWAGQELEAFAIENPPTAKYVRKKLIDVARYKRTQGIRTSKGSREHDVPMTQAEHYHWATETKRLPEDEAKAWWIELKSDPSIEQDKNGRNGRLQLWVPNAAKFKERGTDRFTEHVVEEESKNVKPAEVDDLVEHLDRQNTTQAHSFLAAGATRQVGRKRCAEEAEKKQTEQPASKKISLEREIPKFGPKMEKDLKEMKTSVEKSMQNCNAAVSAIASCTHLLKDKASHMYKGTLQFRMQIAHRWLGSPKVVMLDADEPVDVKAKKTDATASTTPAAKAAAPAAAAGAAPAAADAAAAAPATPIPQASPSKSSVTERESGSEASFRIVFGSAEPSAITAYKARVEKMNLLQLLEIPGRGVPFHGSLASFRCYADLDKTYQEIFDITQAADFARTKADWNESAKTVKEFSVHLAKAASDVLSHVKSLDAKARMDDTKARKHREQEEIKKVKEEAKQTADAIRAKGGAKVVSRPPLYCLDWPGDKIPGVKNYDGDGHEGKLDVDSPWVNIDNDKSHLWITTGKVQQALSNFAGQYKNSAGAKASGRTQYPIVAKHGLEESSVFFQDFQMGELLDISSVQGGRVFMDTLWFYGIVPGTEKLLMPPNCGAMFKYQVAGKVNSLLIDMCSLATAIAAKSLTTYAKLDEYLESIEKWDDTTLTMLLDEGVIMQQHELLKNQMLFIPMGWLVLEKAAGDDVLNYGIRKSFMIKTPVSKKGYSRCMSLFEAAGRNTDRMEGICKLMI